MRTLILAAVLAAMVVFQPAPPAQAQDVEDILALKLQIVELQNKGQLAVSGLTFCRKIMSYASYVPLQDNVIEAGGTLEVYFEPAFWFTNVVEGRYEMWMTQDLTLLDAQGQTLFEREKLLELRMNTGKPVLDVYMTNTFNLGELPPGEYVYVVTLHDELSGQQVTEMARFSIK